MGGSEIVCKAIAERMANTYGMDVTTFGHNVQNNLTHNNVKYQKCLKGQAFLNQIKDLDHLFIYSDSFWGFETILNNVDSIKPSLSIALLGMYAMREKKQLFNIFREKKSKFKVITHSSQYGDYQECFKAKIPVNIIPNGVDLNEFKTAERINVRAKYNIETSNVILNVSNYFYGKGQEHLAAICQYLREIRGESDFTLVQLSNTVKYPHDKTFLNRTKKMFEHTQDIKYKILRDIPREDVVNFFKESDVTVLTSLKEVSPLVLLESMAGRTPWVSMDVGNATELKGGIVIPNSNHDNKGYKLFSGAYVQSFASMLHMYLSDASGSFSDGKIGKSLIDVSFNWDKICEQYYNIFIG